MNFNFKNNYQIIFLVILSIIIVFQFYQLFNDDCKNEDDSSSDSSDIETYHETESATHRVKSNKKNIKLNLPKPSNKIEKYGQPHDIFDDKESRIMFWKLKGNPWSNLYFNSTKNTMTFGLNTTISSDLLKQWNQVIPNIGFNEKDKNVAITTEDEESALAVANLLLSTIHQELTIKEIVESNLLDISLAKIRAHPLVKTKILEQINEKLTLKKNTVKSDHSIDLATSKMNVDAYGGNEFSFI